MQRRKTEKNKEAVTDSVSAFSFVLSVVFKLDCIFQFAYGRDFQENGV